jgi:hypothetical protein
MRIIIWVTILLITLVSIVFAQQDPNDPGLPDSVIIGSAFVDTGQGFIPIRIYVVTDDSVAFYNMPLFINISSRNLGAGGTSYFPPLNTWDLVFDSLGSGGFYRIFGIGDLGFDTVSTAPLYTHGLRTNVMILHLFISLDRPNQIAVIDSMFDPRNGSLLFALTNGLTEFKPVFQRGYITIYGTGVDEETAIPARFNLKQNYPNPFNPSTTIEFLLAEGGDISLAIYDILGRKIRTLQDGYLNTGSYTLVWDGKDDSGADVPSGTYFCRLTTVSISESKRMVLIR